MIIALAQTEPVSGSLTENINDQLSFVKMAAYESADLVIFPELSLTGYEPELVERIACDEDDTRLKVFQETADSTGLTIITSAPLKRDKGITISLLIFQPHQTLEVYSKRFLHEDEEPFFVPENCPYQLHTSKRIALAICYEISVEAHFNSFSNDAIDIYLASVAKTATGSVQAHERLSQVARDHQIMTMMSNCVGPCGGVICTGQSAAWNTRGKLLGSLTHDGPGILLINTEDQTANVLEFEA